MKYIYLPIAFSLAVTFSACKNEHKTQDPELTDIIRGNTIIIKGSDTELPMVKDLCMAFKTEHHEVLFDLSGGGSGIGIEALINNEADIANSSREMKTEEIARA